MSYLISDEDQKIKNLRDILKKVRADYNDFLKNNPKVSGNVLKKIYLSLIQRHGYKKIPITLKKIPLPIKKIPITVRKIPITVNKIPITVKKIPITVKEKPKINLNNNYIYWRSDYLKTHKGENKEDIAKAWLKHKVSL